MAGKDRDFLESLRHALESRPPFEVVAIAESGPEAIELAESHEPSIVLMESALDRFNGVEMTQRLRELPTSPAVVLLTSGGQNGSVPEFDQAADAYLRKSPDAESVIDLVLAFAVQRRLAG